MAETTERSLVPDKELGANPSQGLRVLAFEVRSEKIGFAVFEGPTRLLDWGVRHFAHRKNHSEVALGKRIDTILHLYQPSIIVAHQRSDYRSRAKQRGLVMAAIQKEATGRSISFRVVDTKALRDFFLPYECKTKYEIASTLAEWFESLTWKLPLKRMPWHSEHHNLVIFDAVAAGVVFFAGMEPGSHSMLNNSCDLGWPFRWPLTDV